jgi:hypothetical protein
MLYAVLQHPLPDVPIHSHIVPHSRSPDLYIRQAVVFPPIFINPLDDRQLLEALQPLVKLTSSSSHWLDGIDSFEDLSLPYIHSIVNHSLEFVDKAVVKSLLLAPRLHGTVVLSARGLLISYISESPEQDSRWNEALDAVSSSPVNYESRCALLSTDSTTSSRKTLLSTCNLLPGFPRICFFLLSLYSLFALYMGLSFTDTRSIRSTLGLVIAYVVQMTLAIFSAATVVSMVYREFSFFTLWRFAALPLIVVIVGIENTFRLINAIGHTPCENSPLGRVVSAVCNSAPSSIILVVENVAMLLIGLFLGFTPIVNAVCLFTALALILDLILHLTYFTALLSVDLRRLELDDLILSTPMSPGPVTTRPQNFGVIRLRTFLYANYLYPKQRLPIIVLAMVLIFISLASTGRINSVELLTSPTPPPETMTLFLDPLLQLTKMVLVYEPIVLKYDDVCRCFRMTPSLSASSAIMSGYSVYLFLEFVASLVFILSLAGVVLKSLLPVRDETQQQTDNAMTAGNFFSKDLIGCHTLDIVQTVVHRSWIATVSMDHKVCVWNAALAGSQTSDVNIIPLSPEIWPISKVVLNGTSQMIAIVSAKHSVVEIWNFGTSTLLQSFHHVNIMATSPVEMFFSRSDFVMISKPGLLTSVSAKGRIDTVKLGVRGTGAHLVAARRLLTPKINEKVVCLFSDNTITVATHIVESRWTFRQLPLFESLFATAIIRLPEYAINESTPYAPSIPSTRPMVLRDKLSVLVPIPALNMVLISTDLTASVLDVHTGVILRHIQHGLFKPGSMRVFHSQPTHCRFCGCASIESISVAYNDVEDVERVICHTLSIDNRAKNNICLRVERDPRETRCLGFEAATEHLHWMDNVEGWEATEINMIMGVRRKEQSLAACVPEVDAPSSAVLRRLAGSFRRSSPPTPGKRKPIQKKPPLSTTWEGWAMSGSGLVTYYKIPDTTASFADSNGVTRRAGRLLIRRVGPVVKYGQKSISVAFGNTMKILYFGSEEFHDDIDYDIQVNGGFANSFGGQRKWSREVAY